MLLRMMYKPNPTRVSPPNTPQIGNIQLPAAAQQPITTKAMKNKIIPEPANEEIFPQSLIRKLSIVK